MEITKRPVVFLMGPTASGKTDLAVHLNQTGQFEIISVDSAMIYREMDIGTAKPDQKTLDNAPHHLIDIRDPDQAYSVSEFCDQANQLIDDIHSRRKIPLLVGGTMMYFNSLQFGLSDLPSADTEIREQLSLQAEQLGWEALHRKLAECDPESAAKIHPNDAQRIQRALEVFQVTGIKLSEFQQHSKNTRNDISIINIGLFPENRSHLHTLIENRFVQMLANGVIEELEQLRQKWSLSLDQPSMRCIGYRQIWNFLEKQCAYDEMKNQAIAATRQLAKRQLTWIRHYPDTRLYDPFMSSTDELGDKIISQIPGVNW
ncbi:MAG: tRNA (adenosine(37)-N6)-dimethylallyltransferase MiaA [Pseudomonadota bacterium]